MIFDCYARLTLWEHMEMCFDRVIALMVDAVASVRRNMA